jgi:uncharacterized membrane protein YgcG
VPAACDSSVVGIGRLVGRTAVSGDTRSFIFSEYEMNLVVAGLFFGTSFDVLLSAPDSCAGVTERSTQYTLVQPDWCSTLLMVDTWLWAVVSILFLASVTTTWISNHFVAMVSDDQLPQYLLDHYAWIMIGSLMVVLGVTLIPLAASTRMMILHGHGGHPGYLSWKAWVLVGLFTLALIMEWVYFTQVLRKTHRFGSCFKGCRFWCGICFSCGAKDKLRRGLAKGGASRAPSPAAESPQGRYETRQGDVNSSSGDHSEGENKDGDSAGGGEGGGNADCLIHEMQLPYF